MGKHLNEQEKETIRQEMARLIDDHRRQGFSISKANSKAIGFIAQQFNISANNCYQLLREVQTVSADQGHKVNTSIHTANFTTAPETSSDYEIKKRKPKILFFDIETAPNLAYVWGKYEQNVLDYTSQWYILSFSAKWSDGEVFSRCLPDYVGYKPHTENDRTLVNELWELFNEADVIVGHNGDSFDIKKTQARFVVHNLPPPTPFKTIDTKKLAKRSFNFNSNKLDDLGKTLGVGRKLKHTGFDLWLGCLNGDKESWQTMREYNEQDVLLLERVYLRLRPYATIHPNIAVLSETENGCRNCGHAQLEQKGFSLTATGTNPNYQCLNCGAWSKGRHKKVSEIR